MAPPRREAYRDPHPSVVSRLSPAFPTPVGIPSSQPVDAVRLDEPAHAALARRLAQPEDDVRQAQSHALERASVALGARGDADAQRRTHAALVDAATEYATWERVHGRPPERGLVGVKDAFATFTHVLRPSVAADALRAVMIPTFLAGYYGPTDSPDGNPAPGAAARAPA